MKKKVSHNPVGLFVFAILLFLVQSCFVPKEFDMPISVVCNCVPQSLKVSEDLPEPGEKAQPLTNKRKQLFLDCLARADFQQKTAFEVDNWKDKIPTTPRKLFYEKVTKNCPEALDFLKLIQ